MLLINLYGAPGSGKSTTRADVFRLLKQSGVNCEEIAEKAKELTWEKSFNVLKSQAYLFGKQLKWTEILDGQVDVAITDSPLLLSEYYGRKYSDYPESFYQGIRDISAKYHTISFFINRSKPYNPKGRSQTEEEANEVATEMKQMLNDLGVEFTEVDSESAEMIVEMIRKSEGFSE